jgi:hypothetical protein
VGGVCLCSIIPDSALHTCCLLIGRHLCVVGGSVGCGGVNLLMAHCERSSTFKSPGASPPIKSVTISNPGELPPLHHSPRESMSITRSLDDAEERWASIHQWQANTIESSTEDQFQLAAHRYGLIIRLYKLLLKLLRFEKDHDINQRRLKRAFETLVLWGQQYGVSIGELDRLIDQSWGLRRSVLRTLTSIGRTLTDRLFSSSQLRFPLC